MTIPDVAVGDPIRASTQNEIIDTLSAQWTPYTPTLTAATTNPTLGSGSKRFGEYVQIGAFVAVHVLIEFGTSGTSQGSGAYSIGLPVTAAGGLGVSGDPGTTVGTGTVVCNGNFTNVTVEVSATSGANFMHYVNAAVNGSQLTVGAGQPGNWTAGDYIRLFLTYQAA